MPKSRSLQWAATVLSAGIQLHHSDIYRRRAHCVTTLGGIMKLPHRRHFLHLAAGAAGLPALPRIAKAQAYPSRPVRIIVGFQAGTASDIIARLIAQWFSDRLGQRFVVENRPGAAGNAAAGNGGPCRSRWLHPSDGLNRAFHQRHAL
jgi:hypothetical protein